MNKMITKDKQGNIMYQSINKNKPYLLHDCKYGIYSKEFYFYIGFILTFMDHYLLIRCFIFSLFKVKKALFQRRIIAQILSNAERAGSSGNFLSQVTTSASHDIYIIVAFNLFLVLNICTCNFCLVYIIRKMYKKSSEK